MLRIITRRSNDVNYFTDDQSLEIEGLREGGPGWWLRGAGDTSDPSLVSQVFTSTQRSQVCGYDIVIAAPRPVSILLAVDPDNARGLIQAHRTSVLATMSYLEDRAVVVRDRRDGDDRDERGRWRNIVGFTHGLSRHGEPHLHDHVLVGARTSGASTVLDSRSLFAHANTADALYRTSLRHELALATPWRSWRSFHGVEHVENLDEGYRALWGGHFADKGQKLAWSRATTVASWMDDTQRYESMGSLRPPSDRGALDEHSFCAAFEGHDRVSRRSVVAAWANAATFGASPASIAASVNSLYPALIASRGVRETTISTRRARMTAHVREFGPRPLDRGELVDWNQRSRVRSFTEERSR